MIVGAGVDLAEVPRIRAAIGRYGAKFIDRIYTPGEIAYVERRANRFERYAARFAAKEAGMKAIGTGCSSKLNPTIPGPNPIVRNCSAVHAMTRRLWVDGWYGTLS